MFIVCGINHKNTPLLIRDKISCLVQETCLLLQQLISIPTINEVVILSTCNRLEFYCESNSIEDLILGIEACSGVIATVLRTYGYIYVEDDGVRHILGVGSGLDSMALGEPQILGQIKSAYLQACQIGTACRKLGQIFRYVFAACKKIRHSSGLGENPVSLAYAAVQLILKRFHNLKQLNVFLIGSGETAQLVAKYFHKYKITNCTVISRNLENASKLSDCFSGKAISIVDMPQHLAEADIVISATSCPFAFITKSLIEQVLAARNNKPMFFIDLAMPCDIEMTVATLPNVTLYNLDMLQETIDLGVAQRRNAANKAEQIIADELISYARWRNGLQANNAINDYRRRMRNLANMELERSLAKLLLPGANQHVILREFCTRMLNKFIHAPTVGLRQAAIDERGDLLVLLEYLYQE